MTLMKICADGSSRHEMCHRAGSNCWQKCKVPQANCIELRRWTDTHGRMNLPHPAFYYIYGPEVLLGEGSGCQAKPIRD